MAQNKTTGNQDLILAGLLLLASIFSAAIASGAFSILTAIVTFIASGVLAARGVSKKRSE